MCVYRALKSQITTVSKAPELTVDLVDLGVLRQDFVGQLLRRGQHLGVMHRDQVLNELLQLVSVHLEKSL